MRLYKFLLLFMLLTFSSIAYAESPAVNSGNGFGGLIVKKEGAKINWGNGFITATSEVLPMQDTIDPIRTRALTVRQGGVESRKLLLDSVLSIQLDGRRKVSSLLKNDIKTMNSLRGFVQNSLLSTALAESGSVEVSASLNIRNGLSSIIIPPTIPFLSGIAPTISGKRNEGAVMLELAENGEVAGREATVHSGIIIDARGFNLTPVLLPLIYDGKGVGVYGPFAVSRESVLKHGLVAYMVDDASENVRSRVGNFPLVVKPVNTQGNKKCNLVLSLDAGVKVRAVLKRKSVVDNCAVVILVDGSKAEIVMEESTSEGVDVAVDKVDTSTVDSGNGIQEDSLDDKTAVPAQ